MNRGRGRPRFANVHAIGFDKAAREVSERIYAKNATCRVWILPSGDIAMRQMTDSHYRAPSDATLVGVYARLHSTRQIRDDMREHVEVQEVRLARATR